MPVCEGLFVIRHKAIQEYRIFYVEETNQYGIEIDTGRECLFHEEGVKIFMKTMIPKFGLDVAYFKIYRCQCIDNYCPQCKKTEHHHHISEYKDEIVNKDNKNK